MSDREQVVEAIATIEAFAEASGIAAFMNSTWGWPIVESLHFIGLCLLFGTVGLFDLRVLGLATNIPIAALHRFVVVGVAGFLLNACSGFLFFVSAPDQYSFNPAFQLKMFFMFIAAGNMLLFYLLFFRPLLDSKHSIATGAKVAASVSLVCWTLVIVFGRLITYFRPPYHWCFWC